MQCARCHDHKFDPIPQADYYALQAVFAATDKAERPYDADPAVAQSRRELSARREEARKLAAAKDARGLDKLRRQVRHFVEFLEKEGVVGAPK